VGAGGGEEEDGGGGETWKGEGETWKGRVRREKEGYTPHSRRKSVHLGRVQERERERECVYSVGVCVCVYLARVQDSATIGNELEYVR
jgi:hypothetical protein